MIDIDPSHFGTRASGEPWRVDIILAEGFVLVELSGVVEVLRMANRINPTTLFDWTYRSVKGGYVSCRAGLGTLSEPLTDRPTADYVFVIGNTNSDHLELSLGTTISAYSYRKAKLILLSEAASRYISEHPNGSGDHTTHWKIAQSCRNEVIRAGRAPMLWPWMVGVL